MKDLSGMLNEKGFTTILTDINVSGLTDSSEMLHMYSKGLRRVVVASKQPS